MDDSNNNKENMKKKDLKKKKQIYQKQFSITLKFWLAGWSGLRLVRLSVVMLSMCVLSLALAFDEYEIRKRDKKKMKTRLNTGS